MTAQSQGRVIRFFEQALGRENMNYFLYPNCWGRHSTWYKRVLADDSDPVFGGFLRAGAARVVAPVRKEFEAEMQTSVASGGQIWGGSLMPRMHDPDYLPVAREIEAVEYPALGTPGEWWETTLPTNEIYLRASSTLPSWTVDDKWNWTPAPDGAWPCAGQAPRRCEMGNIQTHQEISGPPSSPRCKRTAPARTTSACVSATT